MFNGTDIVTEEIDITVIPSQGLTVLTQEALTVTCDSEFILNQQSTSKITFFNQLDTIIKNAKISAVGKKLGVDTGTVVYT